MFLLGPIEILGCGEFAVQHFSLVSDKKLILWANQYTSIIVFEND